MNAVGIDVSKIKSMVAVSENFAVSDLLTSVDINLKRPCIDSTGFFKIALLLQYICAICHHSQLWEIASQAKADRMRRQWSDLALQGL